MDGWITVSGSKISAEKLLAFILHSLSKPSYHLNYFKTKCINVNPPLFSSIISNTQLPSLNKINNKSASLKKYMYFPMASVAENETQYSIF